MFILFSKDPLKTAIKTIKDEALKKRTILNINQTENVQQQIPQNKDVVPPGKEKRKILYGLSRVIVSIKN